ncbi:MAG: glycosyltransferase family 39 protein, partial [Anaerolineales bacterium]|nr:glycosyltransferase family 39 protein [Anaerolineales bacterium]
MIKDETRPFPSLPTIKFVLLCLLLSAFWLRLHHIDAFGFWTDEGLTPLRSGYSILEILSNRVIIQQGVTNDTHPAFFFLIIHFTRLLFGETDFAYRFPATLAGVLLLPLIYQFGRRLRDRRLGGVAAALTAVNPLYLWYADEARMYTIFVLLAAAASYVLWRAIS